MIYKTIKLSRISLCAVAVAGMLAFTSCGEADKAANDAEKTMNDAADKAGEMADDASKKAKEMADDASDAAKDARDEAGDKMDKLGDDMQFEAGSVEASIQEFINGDTPTQTFKLDKIPFEGEEISVEAGKQLDNLALIMKTYPKLKAEVQCHTRGADNKVGAAAKKAASGVRALWVKTKLSARGVEGSRIEANGYGDKQLLPNVDAKDESQNRIEVALTK